MASQRVFLFPGLPNALGAKLIGNICFNLSVQNEIESVLVSDSEIVEAQKLLWENIVCW